MKLARGSELVVASHNPGKVHEIRALLTPLGIVSIGAAELGLIEPEESGATFEENALLKARASAGASQRISLADDSGLAVEALGGAPGIYSARWAGPERNFNSAMMRVQRELDERNATERPAAKFICALAIAEPGGTAKTFVGEVHGHLVFPPRGDKGFGYDPIFVADGTQQTFGEIEPSYKHAISHRARAFRKLVSEVGCSP